MPSVIKNTHILEQLQQLQTVTWDGDVISPSDRDVLYKKLLCDRIKGYNYITKTGIKLLIKLELLKR